MQTGHGTNRNAGRRVAGPTGRRSRVRDAAVVLLLAAAIAASGALPLRAAGGDPATSTRLVRVAESDTLWEIARANAPAGMSTADMVEAIRRLNDLGSRGVLQTGSVVAVPVDEAPVSSFAKR